MRASLVKGWRLCRDRRQREKTWRKKEGEKKKNHSEHSTMSAHADIKEGEKERESARGKIELNSLILNYYLSIMGGMEPGRCAGED